MKLATELSRRATGKTLYVLDEPTTGLHMADVDKLIGVLQRLTETGNSVLVIEHNLDVIKVADYLIDLGPEGGDKGGEIVCEGTPEEVAACEKSYTGSSSRRCWGNADFCRAMRMPSARIRFRSESPFEKLTRRMCLPSAERTRFLLCEDATFPEIC